jgi:phosphoglycerate dehydrogenase-like enzyme
MVETVGIIGYGNMGKAVKLQGLLKFCAMIFFGQHVADANAAQNLL